MEDKTKHIVVFGNGDIAQAAVKEYATRASKTGEDVQIHIVTRPAENTTNRGAGFAENLIQGMATDTKNHLNTDIEKMLGAENHLVFDDKNQASEAKLAEILGKASLIIDGSGVPRKAGQIRADIIASNAPVMERHGTLVGKYVDIEVPVITVGNPADNNVMIYKEAREKAFKEAHPEKSNGELPLSTIAMTTQLDQARPRIFTSRILRAALQGSGKDLSTNHELAKSIKASNITGDVWGEHGETQVIDLESIKVSEKPLKEFISEHNLNYDEITKEIVTKSKGAGAEIIKLRGHSITDAPGKYIADLAEAIMAEEKSTVVACAEHQIDGGEKIASGCQVEVGGGKIIGTPNPYPKHTIENQAIMQGIKDSRAFISKSAEIVKAGGQAKYDAGNEIKSFFEEKDFDVSKDGISYKIVPNDEMSADSLKKIADDIAIVADIIPSRVKIQMEGRKPSIIIPKDIVHKDGKTANSTIEEILSNAGIQITEKSLSRAM